MQVFILYYYCTGTCIELNEIPVADATPTPQLAAISNQVASTLQDFLVPVCNILLIYGPQLMENMIAIAEVPDSVREAAKIRGVVALPRAPEPTPISRVNDDECHPDPPQPLVSVPALDLGVTCDDDVVRASDRYQYVVIAPYPTNTSGRVRSSSCAVTQREIKVSDHVRCMRLWLTSVGSAWGIIFVGHSSVPVQ